MSEKERNKIPLRLPNIEQIPNELLGVYAFWYKPNGKCIYVGKAEKQPVKERLKQEWRDSHNECLKLWIRAFGEHLTICYLSLRKDRIDKMETRLIQRWHPEANIKKQRR